jgi:tyrosyl-DNA phosphodiesterase-1
MDPMVELVCNTAGMTIKGKLTKTQLESMRSDLNQFNSRKYGKNFHAFYALSPGSSHSKILLLVYPDFLRIVITSCNMMDIDTLLGDNHWYIHDLPKLPSQGKDASSGFEAGLLEHLQALKTPDDFIDSIRGAYDYSTVKVHLVTSIPGTFSGPKAEKHGLLRLRHVTKSLDLRLPKKVIEGELQLEICAASIGNLSAKWLDGFYDCALGRKNIEVADADCAVPNLKLFYPTVGDVKSAKKSAQEAASNIGCHIRPWDKASDEIKNIFHRYESKDKGCLFHQKLIMAYDPRESSAPPYYVYIGSANLSQSAWGALENDKKKNQATNDVKLIKLSNFECGVVIPGTLVEDLLEPGTESWREGIVPYIQDAKTYDLRKDRPWNDPRWVTGYTDGAQVFE